MAILGTDWVQPILGGSTAGHFSTAEKLGEEGWQVASCQGPVGPRHQPHEGVATGRASPSQEARG